MIHNFSTVAPPTVAEIANYYYSVSRSKSSAETKSPTKLFTSSIQFSTSFSDKIPEKVISNYRKEKHYGITKAKKKSANA
jgi:hypothetical protein